MHAHALKCSGDTRQIATAIEQKLGFIILDDGVPCTVPVDLLGATRCVRAPAPSGSPVYRVLCVLCCFAATGRGVPRMPRRAAACRSVPRKSLGLCSATSTHVWRRPRALKRWQRDSVPPAPASGAMMAARRAPNRSPAGKRPWPAWDVGGSQAWVWQWTGQGGARGAAGQSWTTDALDVHTRAGGRGAGRRQGRRRPLGAAPGRIGRRSTRRALAAARAPPDSQSPP